MKSNKGYLNDIGQLYGKMLDTVVPAKTIVTEKSNKNFAKGSFEIVSSKSAKKSKKSGKSKYPYVNKKSGPENASGFNPTLQADPKFSSTCEKTDNKDINTHMSVKFEDLYNDVLKNNLHVEDVESVDDVVAAPETGADGELPPTGDDGAAGGDVEDENDNLTPGELIAKALELLNKAQEKIDGSEEDTAMGGGLETLDDLGAKDAPAGAEGELSQETTELKEVKDSAGQSLQGKNNKVTSTQTKLAKSGKADGKVTDKVGNEDTGIHPLVGTAAYLTKLQGKNNKVDTKIKPGQSIGQ